MSYPSPYQPPTPQYPGFDYYQPDLLAPARRASVLMFVLGGLAVLSSLCCAGMGTMLPQMMAENPAAFQKIQRLPNVTPDTIRIALIIMSGLVLLAGVAYLVLGAFVRRGSKVAIVLSVVLSVLGMLLMLLNIASALLQSGDGPQAAGACFFVVPLLLLGLLVVWLFQAMRGAEQATAGRYAMQYWQYAQQQQQQQQQQGYGQPYSQQQPPPPPVPPGASGGIYPPSVTYSPPPPTMPPPRASDRDDERTRGG